MLDAPLQLQEVEIAINQLAVGKYPRLDGIQIEWYKKFMPKIKYLLHSLFLKWIQDKEMSESAKTGVISLLEKPGKDQMILKSWRPLSLLWCDYKLFAKIIANRIQLVINDLIHKDQVGFLKNRLISTNLMDLNSIIISTQKHHMPAAVVCIDFEKAYDIIEWDALYNTLRAYNFGENIISMIKYATLIFQVK